MRSLRYLNSVLTVIAVLLTLTLYTMWMSPAPGSGGGDLLSVSQEAHAQGIPNAGAQRKQIIDELTAVKASVNDLKTTLTNGSVRVKVDSMPSE